MSKGAVEELEDRVTRLERRLASHRSDQELHAHFAIEAMKALVAAPENRMASTSRLAADAARMADLMLEMHLDHFDAKKKAAR